MCVLIQCSNHGNFLTDMTFFPTFKSSFFYPKVNTRPSPCSPMARWPHDLACQEKKKKRWAKNVYYWLLIIIWLLIVNYWFKKIYKIAFILFNVYSKKKYIIFRWKKYNTITAFIATNLHCLSQEGRSK